MKSITLILFAAIFYSSSVLGQGFQHQKLKTIDGAMISGEKLAGKKTLVYILPLSKTDSNFIHLQNFIARYKDTLNIVGILSFEEGYQDAQANALKEVYGKMGIFVSEGVYARKSSGSRQSPFMRWLTDKSGNMHFDMDVQGQGHKFFVSENGRLFAVIPPQLPLTAPFIDKIVHSPNR